MKLPLISYPLTTLRDANIAAKCRSWVSKCCHRDCVNLVNAKGNGHEIHEQLLVLPLFHWLLVNCSGMMDLCKPVPLWSENPISLNIFSNTQLNKNQVYSALISTSSDYAWSCFQDLDIEASGLVFCFRHSAHATSFQFASCCMSWQDWQNTWSFQR